MVHAMVNAHAVADRQKRKRGGFIMKFGRKLISMLMAVTTVATMVASAGAVAPYIGVNMTTGITRRTLFSDNPESIYSTNSINGYLTGTTFNANERLDFGFYHHNYTGQTKRFGIVVMNGNSSSATLTLHHKAIGTSSTNPADEIAMTSPLTRNFFQSASSTVTIPAGSSQFVLYADVPQARLVNGMLSMTSNRGNVYARIVYGNTSTSPSTYFSIANQEPANGTQFCGQVNYAQKNVTVNANSVSAFVIGEWPAPVGGTRPFKNTNEYTTVLSHKTGANELLGGNYGIPYRITINNASGKRLKITPNWDGGAQYANIVMQNAAGTWYTTGTITSGSWYYGLGTGSSSTLTIVIPGANYGNMHCEIVS